ncbi:MAG: nucleoside triphosphate pyrophosphohydrolase [Gammaproteobacteria bacterium]|nr:nucleoside triphosphate pyrophosphohydrolase [Gammaproteobacteria bacterium]MBT5216860.1 nucleoside triphosphate pyrophosphohydrolase [Gammaproteobacteria bacterium]MBT5541498.1 nucleoside triphosphate pyrophosphohydrolase [Gammaproteobacteria bacterium]MBT6074143.1 nucleoside triphosphate pyrophosphohydrolase [Gammaproteobacteria bacterium]MBT7753488.1 nucleoside triphosphate pyrophosphohydrolase [Gammaproteobacteria bacterium]
MEKNLEKLKKITQQLRDPLTGCPWDIEQTFDSIAYCSIEEAYEVVEAIEEKNYDQLKNELGDLLFQVVFHSEIANEKNLFNLDDIVESISTKLISRHPHVFGDEKIDNAREQTDQWEKKKLEEIKTEGDHKSVLDGIGKNQTALNTAFKIGKRARSVGFDWNDSNGVLGKIREELSELIEAINSKNESAIEEEMGDLLFTIVSLSRHLSKNPETALRKATNKFEKRFKLMEHELEQEKKQFSQLSYDEMNHLWNKVKQKK